MVEVTNVWLPILFWLEDLVPLTLLASGSGVPGVVVGGLGLFGYVIL